MSRYIDADICRRRISDERTDDKRWNEALNRACRIVCEQPTAEVVPVSTLEQIRWERDCFEGQIREIGGEPFMKWECTDLAHVVRCKDCKYSEPQCSTTKAILPLECKYRGAVGLDWFCEHGEKVTE